MKSAVHGMVISASLIVVVGVVAFSSLPVWADFVAYHDLGGTTEDVAGAYVTDQGTDAARTNRLRNFADNADTGVDFFIRGANGTVTGTTNDHRYPVVGTEAADIFGASTNPIVTHGGVTVEGGNSGSSYMTFVFTGLQATLLYDVALYGDRNQAPDGVEEFRITDTDWHANAGSAAARIDSFTTRLETRPNTANGFVARWTDVDPGGDGSFSIEVDPEYSSQNNLVYLSAMRLQTAPASHVPEVIYRETFGNDSGSDQGLSHADWTGYYGGSATLLPDSGPGSGTLVSGDGAPKVAPPVNSDPDVNEPDNNVLDVGFARLLWPSGGGVSPALVYTDEYTINRGVYDIESFIWGQASNGGSDSFRIAVEIGGQWYVSDTAFAGPNNNSSSTFGRNARGRSLDFATAQWRSLSFMPGSTLGSPGSMVTLPNGNITAFGLYGTFNATQWFDSYAIAAKVIQGPPGTIILVR